VELKSASCDRRSAAERAVITAPSAGVAVLISPAISVDDHRWAPLQYPKISHDQFVAPIRASVRAVQAHDCRYIMQIGDGEYHAQTSLKNRSGELQPWDSAQIFPIRTKTTTMTSTRESPPPP
jgi:2,4-dienoyl-CoA reductase-like NADH-dependent reductase (Old Yellow Enzyme family)